VGKNIVVSTVDCTEPTNYSLSGFQEAHRGLSSRPWADSVPVGAFGAPEVAKELPLCQNGIKPLMDGDITLHLKIMQVGLSTATKS
jgi:hypothetical protein